MRQHAGMILFIATMVLAAGTVGVIATVMQGQDTDTGSEPVVDGPEITGVSVWGIEDRKAQYTTVTITGGSQSVNLDDALITLQTDGGQVDVPLRR